jgi:hypothetical protein
LHEASGDERLQAGAIAQFHGNVDGVGDDPDIVAIAQIARYVRGSSAGGEANRLVFLDEFGGGEADAAFLGHTMLFAILKKRVITKRFV